MIIEKYDDQAEIKRLLEHYVRLINLLVNMGFFNEKLVNHFLESAEKYIKMLGE